MKRISNPLSGNLINRFVCVGIGIKANKDFLSEFLLKSTIKENPRFAIKGNGWAKSIARGVKIGNTFSRKYCSSHDSSVSDISLISSRLRSVFSNSSSKSRHSSCCFLTKSEANAFMPVNCSRGDKPSSLTISLLAFTNPRSPATLTIKNSSRLLPEIERNLNLSSKG